MVCVEHDAMPDCSMARDGGMVRQNRLGASTAELTVARQEMAVLEEMLETTNTEMQRVQDKVQVYECQFGAAYDSSIHGTMA